MKLTKIIAWLRAKLSPPPPAPAATCPPEQMPRHSVSLCDLQRSGWTLRTAARELGCTAGHLCRCLKGERYSASLEARMLELLSTHQQDS